jgi:hypothetical protein
VHAADEKSADLIAITASPNSDGSIAESIIGESHIPVLAIPVHAIGNKESPADAPAA